MRQVIRAQYRAVLKESVGKAEFAVLAETCKKQAEQKKEDGKLLTAALCRYENMLFLYVEYIVDKTQKTENIAAIPDEWFKQISAILEFWPEMKGKCHWVYMYPVFWFDESKNLESWKRKQAPDARCGRIAVLFPEKLFSYVCHHQAIVKEGLLVGDRYQMISLHENILFSYFETPRDREQVNIKRKDKNSKEIEKWDAENPESHFYHFPQANGENFLIIDTVFSIG